MIQFARNFFLLTLLVLGNACAQVSGLPFGAVPTTEKPAESRAIPIGDLPRRMVEEIAFTERVVQKSGALTKPDALAKELESIKRDLDALGKRMLGKPFETLPLSGVESLERHLLFLDDRLQQLQEDLQSITRPLSEDSGELAQRRKAWQEARQSFAEMLSPTLLNSIDDLNKELQNAEKAASEPLSNLLSLSQQARRLQTRVGNNLLIVRDQITLIGRSFWRFDSDNLFAALRDAPAQSEGSLEAVMNGLAVQSDFMKAFDRQAKTRHILVAILALLALPVFFFLSRKAKRIIDRDSTLEVYRTTLSRPISAWVLFIAACMLAADFHGPMFRLRLLLAVAWLPVMRLQPKWMHDNIGRAIYATALFFLLSFFSQLIAGFPLDFRLTLLLNGVLLLGTLIWLFYHLSAKNRWRDSRRRRAAQALIVVCCALITLAIVANLLGGVHLAPLLTDGSISSLYLALCLFAIRELVRAYMRVLVVAGSEKDMVSTRHAGRLFDVALNLLNLALAAAWMAGTLNAFRVLRPLRSELDAISGYTIGFGSISITIGGIVLFCLSVFLSFWIAKTIRGVLSDDVLPNMTLPRGVANSVSTMSYYFLLILGLLVALTAAGFELSQLAIVVGALSVGIGFGLNTVINNFVGGLILMIERPIQPGDIIELAGTTGKVQDIGIRATTLATFDGADVLVPNGMLLAEKLTNWTLNNERRRIEIPVGVAYGNDPRTVQSLLLAVANNTEGVSHDPVPAVLFMGFGESSLDFSVRAWTDYYDQSQVVRSEMAIEIHAALKAAGIEIPFPQRDVHIHSADPGVNTPSALGS